MSPLGHQATILAALGDRLSAAKSGRSARAEGAYCLCWLGVIGWPWIFDIGHKKDLPVAPIQ